MNLSVSWKNQFVKKVINAQKYNSITFHRTHFVSLSNTNNNY